MLYETAGTVPLRKLRCSAVSCCPHEPLLQVPEFRVAYSINTDALDALYKKLKPKGVTMSGLLAKAAGVALSKFPTLYAGELQILIHPCSVSQLAVSFN